MNKSKQYKPDADGHFGEYGGRYVPELLIPALEELDREYARAKKDPVFTDELVGLQKNYLGRPTPLYFAENLSKKLGGAKIYLKNEGLNHTGAHKMNHALGQALLARRMGKKRLIAETGAGQHGLATATVAAKFGFECTVYMGAVDIERQRPNVFWMEQLGATVVPVTTGSKTLKDAVNAAIKDWIEHVEDSYYLLGSAVGPHPYPTIVRDFQTIVGEETKAQISDYEDRVPDYCIACVGGGSNAVGFFTPFLETDTKLIAVEAGGRGVEKIGDHASRFHGGRVGVVEGYKSYFLQDTDGNIAPTHSVSAGLDYPGVSPLLAELHDTGRVAFEYATDQEALDAFVRLTKTEGIIPALESAHAVAHAIRLAPTLSKDKVIVVNLSGRGDKDIFIVARALGDTKWTEFLKTQI